MPMAKIVDFTALGGFISLSLNANASAGISLEGIGLGINFFNGTTPIVGTYSETDVTLDHLVVGVHTENNPTFTYNAGIFTPSVKPLVVKILTKTATEMTGTFEGAFYKTLLPAGTIAGYSLLTNGEFKLKIQ